MNSWRRIGEQADFIANLVKITDTADRFLAYEQLKDIQGES